MSAPFHYELKHPISVKVVSGDDGETRTETIDSIELRRPTGRDCLLMDELQDKPVHLSIAMVTALSGLTRSQVERLDAQDLAPLADYVMSIVGRGQ